MSLAAFLRHGAGCFPGRTAIYYENTEITYGQLDLEVDSVASGILGLGLKHQEMVGLMLGNGPDFVRSFFGITRAGGVVVPLNPLYKGEEIIYMLNEASVVFLIATQALLPLVQSVWSHVPSLRQLIITGGEKAENIVPFKQLLGQPGDPVDTEVKPGDIAACLFTSGTTGRPKGALLSHGNLIFDVQAATSRIEFRPEDRHLCVLPLFHSFALTATLLCPFYTGGTMAILPHYSPDLVLDEIRLKRLTVFCGIPPMYATLLPALANINSDDLHSLRLCVSGGAPMPVEVMQKLENQYGIMILEGDGPTETSPVSYVNPPGLRKIGSVGPPLDGVRVSILDENEMRLPVDEIGEICIQGPNVMQGYLNQPEATAEAMKGGWFHTGDLGKVDQDGYVYIVDRKKDMIIVGGLNVYPREIEECLNQHPKVAQAAVIGMPDDWHGEIPMAIIVLNPGEDADPKEFILHCRKFLANYKCPRRVVVVESLPLTATGKVDKKQLRKEYGVGSALIGDLRQSQRG
jgi:long-chain acyl-CoA synthetase